MVINVLLLCVKKEKGASCMTVWDVFFVFLVVLSCPVFVQKTKKLKNLKT